MATFRPKKKSNGCDSAALKGRVTVVQQLLQHDAPVEKLNTGGCTPLVKAAKEGHVYVVEVLLEHGAVLAGLISTASMSRQ